jgi:hypothetical protein
VKEKAKELCSNYPAEPYLLSLGSHEIRLLNFLKSLLVLENSIIHIKTVNHKLCLFCPRTVLSDNFMMSTVVLF